MSSADSRAQTPEAYRYWIDERVRFADLDMLGHVNNKAFMTYAESGRAAFMRDTGLWVPGAARQNVIARLEADYLRELHYPAELRVGVRVAEIGTRSFVLGLGIFGPQGCAALVRTVMVRIDTASRGPVALDEAARAVLERHRG